MMNQRSNKKRSTSNRGGRGKGMERQLSVEGVYANHRFMQSVGTLVGLPVQVSTKTKEVFEGVFTTFGPNFDLVLDLPHVVSSSGESSVITNPESIKRKMIFTAQDIVVIKVINVDPDYATKENFAVDAVISKYNGQAQSEKELEPWHGDETAYSDLTLGDESANGWDADEMFKKNRDNFGVTTTYSPDMEGYTTPLQKKNTKEWKEQEAKAQQIALEIEHSPLTQTRAEVENGEDEEEKFSAVQRPDQGTSSGKYMPPQKRKTQSGINSKQPSRVTPSPQSGGGPPIMPGGGRYNSHSGPPPPAAAPPPSAATSSSSSSSSSLSSTSSPSYTNNSTQSSSMPSSASGSMMGPPYPHHQNQVKLPHKHSAPQSSSGGPAQHSIQGDPKLNGEAKDSRKHENSQSYSRSEGPPHKESFHPPDHGHSPHSHPHSHSHQHQHHPPPLQQQAPPPSQSYQPHTQSYPSDARRAPEPRSQREPRKPRNQKEEQQMADLKKFGEDFKLSDNGEKKIGPPPPHHSHPAPSIPPMPKHHTSHQMPPSAASSVSQTSPSQPIPHQQPPLPPSPPQQIQSAASEPQSNSGSSSSNTSSNNSGGIPPAHQQGPPPQHPPPMTPTEGKTPPEEEKMNPTVSSSKLNPNAKEFVFNPNAKPFSPRSPSTTTPPRAQTPQIVPPQSQMGAGPVPSVGFPPNMVQAYVMAPQPFSGQSQPRYPKRGLVGNQRPEYTPSMQVAAATGHPILAPAPLTPITTQQTLPAVQLSQNMMPQTPQPYHQYQGMPMMVRFPPPTIPMVTAMVPTSMGMCYQGAAEGHQNSQGHTPQHMYVTPGLPPHQASQPHPAATPGAHPGQPPTPQGHNAGGPAPPPNMPAQPPTPGPTPPQAMMYGGHTGAPMGGQPTIPQHLPQHSPHTAQSPHNIYSGHNAALVAAAAAAQHHPPPTQLVMINPPMMPHGAPPPHSGTGHVPSSAAGYTPTSSAAAMQQLNHGHPVHYIPSRRFH